ncbi:MAG TPA: sensor histidine kinase [Rhodanobacter sp.]|nr:sensor histidine kinase [Rhodanobacter sp.]
MNRRIAAFFLPAPDSLAAAAFRQGKSPWVQAVHLLWSFWLFVTPLWSSEGWDARWLVCTLVSYPVFLLLYYMSVMAPRSMARGYALAMVLLSMVLVPWYPSGLTYFVYGCVMLRVCRMRFHAYLAWLAVLNATLLLETWLLQYPWQAIFTIPVTSFIVGIVINAERANEEKDAQLQLSHDEVRRLAATAERERIGRDLHDLLGHTLSLITLKLELSRKLFDRDKEAARREIEDAEKVARHALAEVRSAVTGIRTADLAAELASARLLLASSMVHLDYGSPPELPGEIERGLSLVLREAATNISRHAAASRARIEWMHERTRVCMQISDNGRGGIASDGNGLSGMRERVRALGGTLTIDSPRAQGTRLKIVVPVPALRLVETSSAFTDPAPQDPITSLSEQPAA